MPGYEMNIKLEQAEYARKWGTGSDSEVTAPSLEEGFYGISLPSSGQEKLPGYQNGVTLEPGSGWGWVETVPSTVGRVRTQLRPHLDLSW